jgi:hypothetical protein
MGDYDIKSVISNAYNITRQFYPGLKIPQNQENTNDKTNIILKRGNNGINEIVAEMNVKTFEKEQTVDKTDDFDENELDSEISSIQSGSETLPV